MVTPCPMASISTASLRRGYLIMIRYPRLGAPAQAHAAIALAQTGEFANAGNPHGNMDIVQVTSVNGGGGTGGGRSPQDSATSSAW